MLKSLRILSAFVLAVVAVGPVSLATASAQTTNNAQAVQAGAVTGTVADPQGAPVASATVRMNGPAFYKTQTDAKGSFTISNVSAGFYAVTVEKAGFTPAHQADLAVLAGETQNVSVTLQPVSFSSLREIASVRVRSTSRFNATTASSQVVTGEDYARQGQVQVQRVLDQTPGIVIDHPGTSANNSSPGAITFPSIRGGLGFETASFIDGHPVSVGKFGDYVTTFLSPFVLQSTEIVKGPGSMPGEIAYAINGTTNFRTKDPTLHPTGTYTVGYSKNSGSFGNAGYSNTFGKLGVLFDYAVDSYYGPLNNTSAFWNLPSSTLVNGKPVGFTTNAPGDTTLANSPFNYSGQLVACCFQVSDVFVSKNELAKIRYKFSDATSFTASYIGSQTWTEQNGNHVMGINQLFAPCGVNGYTAITCATASNTYGPYSTGSHVFTWQNIFPPMGEWEVNNEPILEAELHTTMGRDSFLGRWYSASINRLQYNAMDSPTQTFTGNFALYGCSGAVNLDPTKNNCSKGTGSYFNGTPTTVTFPGGNYFRDSEEDKLKGGTFEWDHPLGDKGSYLTFSYDQTATRTYATGWSGTTFSVSVPGGERQRFNTAMLRGTFQVSDKLKVQLGNYLESYYQRFSPDGGTTYQEQTVNRYDPRIAFEYRANPFVSFRASAGGSIAPPYAFLLNTSNSVSLRGGATVATGSLNNPNLQPETSFGYNIGADYRIGADRQTFVTWDAYLNNLRNQFITANVVDPACPFYDPVAKACTQTAPTPTNGIVPVLKSEPLNIGTSRYQGVEVAVRRAPTSGFGWTAQGAVIRAYPYGISTACDPANPTGLYAGYNPIAKAKQCFVNNLGIVNDINFQGSGTSGQGGTLNNGGGTGSGSFGISNHAIPYLQAYGELNYRFSNGMYASFGEQLYGKNNSLNLLPFWIANANLRVPITKLNDSYVQFSVDNVFNTYGNTYITQAGGVAASLINGQIGVTNANTIGPRDFRMIFTQNFGQGTNTP